MSKPREKNQQRSKEPSAPEVIAGLIDRNIRPRFRDSVDALSPAQAKNTIQSFRKEFSKLHRSADNDHKGWMLLGIAMVLRGQRRYLEASHILENAKSIFLISSHEQGLAATFHELSFVNREMGRNALALEYAYKSLQVFESGDYQAELAWAYDNLSGIQLNLFNRPESLWYAKRARALFAELNLQNGLAWNACNMGALYYTMGFYDHAHRFYTEALEIFRKQQSLTGMSGSFLGLGVVARANCHLEEAEHFLKQAQAIYEKLRIDDRTGLCLLHLAAVRRMLGKPGEAESINKKAIQLFSPLRNQDGVAWALFQLSQLLRDQGQTLKAWEILREGLNLHTDIGNRKGIGVDQNEMGKAYMSLDDFNHARECFIKARVLAEQLDEIPLKFDVYKNLATLHLEEGLLARTAELIEKCETIAEKNKAGDLEVDLLLLKVRYNLVIGSMEEAYQQIEQARELASHYHLVLVMPSILGALADVMIGGAEIAGAIKVLSEMGKQADDLEQPIKKTLSVIGRIQLLLYKRKFSQAALLMPQINRDLKLNISRRLKAKLMAVRIMVTAKINGTIDPRMVEQCVHIAQSSGSALQELEIRRFAVDLLKGSSYVSEFEEQRLNLEEFLQRSSADLRSISDRQRDFSAMPISPLI